MASAPRCKNTCTSRDLLLCWVVILSLYWDSSSLFVLPTMPVWCALATA